MTASIVGWAHTPFGKFDAETVESLVVKVANEALADAGIARRARTRSMARLRVIISNHATTAPRDRSNRAACRHACENTS